MAMINIRRWHLAVLSVALDLSQREAAVVADLLTCPDGRPQLRHRLSLPVGAYGFGPGVDPPEHSTVPPELLSLTQKFVSGEAGNESALWLRLVPPYGHLGAVPWEDVLTPATDRPVLRVPDRLPVAADPGGVWSMAVVLNAPSDAHWAASYVEAFVGTVRHSFTDRVKTHVFSDRTVYDELRARLQKTDPHTLLHDPGDAVRVHRERSKRGVTQFRGPGGKARRSPTPLPWADWIATGLDGEAVRALHLVAPACFDGSRPQLTVSPDPAQPVDPRACTYVAGEEIRLLADGIGASTLSLGSPPDNSSDVSTRLLADALGLERAGPTFYSDLLNDPAGDALARAYAFVAAPPGSEPIPRGPALFGYLQPEHVKDSLAQLWPDPDQPQQSWLTGRAPISDSATSRALLPGALAAVPGDAVAGRYASEDYVPGWVAATERFMESKAAELLTAAGVPGETPALKQAYDQGVARAMGELRGLADGRTEEA